MISSTAPASTEITLRLIRNEFEAAHRTQTARLPAGAGTAELDFER